MTITDVDVSREAYIQLARVEKAQRLADALMSVPPVPPASMTEVDLALSSDKVRKTLLKVCDKRDASEVTWAMVRVILGRLFK